VSDDEAVGKYIEKEMSGVYFHQSLIGYIVGIAATFMVMISFQTAQPALLYILPTQLCMYLLAAFLRRDFSKMLHYDEDIELAAPQKGQQLKEDDSLLRQKGSR
jgi:minor histocompatibility antigen H13